MKKVILTYGLIAGAIVAAFMVASSYNCMNNQDSEQGMILGYTGMLVAFSFVFIGIKSFRDKQNGGVITFGQALKIGALISLIASTIYVCVWLVEYYCFFPDFMDKYSASALKKLNASGLSAADLKTQRDQILWFKDVYKTPIGVILTTYMEVLPVGALVPLISAAILKRKSKPEATN